MAVTLDKGHVSLAKGETVSLVKADDALTRVRVGLGWDPARSRFFGIRRSIDLDASALVFDAKGGVIDTIWFANLTGVGIRHHGDNLTGAGDGDDEVITIDLAELPPRAQHVVLTINSYRGHTFDRVENAYCRLVDDRTDEELVRYSLTESPRSTGMFMAILSRVGSAWEMRALGIHHDGRTVREMTGRASALVGG